MLCAILGRITFFYTVDYGLSFLLFFFTHSNLFLWHLKFTLAASGTLQYIHVLVRWLFSIPVHTVGLEVLREIIYCGYVYSPT